MHAEWITTVEAARLLDCSHEHTRAVLKTLDCVRREANGRATLWRRGDVLAAKELQRELSYTPRTLTKHDVRPAPPTTRPCLCCARQFPSEGIHNRLCRLCRDGDGLEHSISLRLVK